MNKPTLSVIIAAFNAEVYLRDSILSLLNEKLSGLEIIVVDDGSSDLTGEVVKGLPVKLIRLQKNIGQAAAQNRGVKEARGKYLCFFDSDDILVKGGLWWRVKYLECHPKANLVAGKIAGIIDSQGKLIGSYRKVLNPDYRLPPSRLTKKYLASGGEFPSQSWLMLFRKEFLKKVGPMDETLRCAHDNDFFYRVLAHGPIPFENKSVAYYRLHETNLSGKWKSGKFQLYPRNQAENLWVHLANGISPK